MEENKNKNEKSTEKENKQAMSIGGMMVKKMIEAYMKSQEGR